MRLNQNHPLDRGAQREAVMATNMADEQLTGGLRSKVIRHIARFDRKGDIKDLEESQRYLNKLINHLRALDITQAYCNASGEILFGGEVPDGALLLAAGHGAMVRDKVLSLAERSSPKGQGSMAMVPGFSNNHKTNLEAVARFKHHLYKLIGKRNDRYTSETNH